METAAKRTWEWETQKTSSLVSGGLYMYPVRVFMSIFVGSVRICHYFAF